MPDCHYEINDEKWEKITENYKKWHKMTLKMIENEAGDWNKIKRTEKKSKGL